MKLKILTLKEGDEWVSRTLELDLIGEGATSEEAEKNLREAVEALISFAVNHNCLEVIQLEAESKWFDKWETIPGKRKIWTCSLTKSPAVVWEEAIDDDPPSEGGIDSSFT